MMCSRRLCLIASVIALSLNLSPVMGQADTPVINATNIDQLKPVEAIDFASLPAEAGTILNGRMYVSSDSRHLAVVNRDGQVVFLSDIGELLEVTDPILTPDGFPATFIDGAFDPSGQRFGAIHTAGSAYIVSLFTIRGQAETRRVPSDDKPVGIWLDARYLWLEVLPQDSASAPYLVRIAYATGPLASATLETKPLVLAGDTEAVARIGRLPPPYAVTAAENGRVSRWDLSAGHRTGLAQVSDVPIYGALTPDGRYLAWRDPASMALHELDFATGQDRVVITLRGTYIPFILLTLRADVILGIDIGGEPKIAAWDVATGKMHDLGLYRQCQRPPDMVSLTLDGTTVALGCDTGLEVWQIDGR